MRAVLFLIYFFFLLKILFRNNTTLSAAKNKTNMIIVKAGFTGASVARNIMGKPNTIAGKF